MICTGCGAGLTKAMVDDGECGYCHTVVARTVPKTDEIVAKAVEKLASVKDAEPKVVVRVIAPDVVPRVTVDGARVIDSIGARIAGCFTGCMSMGVSIGITAMILGFVAWSLWMENHNHAPSPSPSPSPAPVTSPAPSPSPNPDRPRRGRGR